MSDIRYVSLSDLHLGEEDSLLTNLQTASTETDTSKPSPVMEALVACLRHLIPESQPRKPTLILNGDILELALTTADEAAMAFERLIKLILPRDGELFERIIYIPGNHDHHMWELGRETQYVNHIMGIAPGKPLPAPWHTTNMFVENVPKPVPSYFLTRLVQRYDHLKDMAITTAYPNFGLVSDNRQKCVIFCHGHFIESIYQLMSTLKTMVFPKRRKPTHVWDIEAENFAWIDFFWSTLGRSGEAGRDVEWIYESLHSPKQFKKLLSNLAKSLAKEYNVPLVPERWEPKVLEWALDKVADKVGGLERHQTDRLLSQDAENGLWTYVQGPLSEQILIELSPNVPTDVPMEGPQWEQVLTDLGPNMPSDVTLVFGHTHKPFQEDMNFDGYPQWVNVYNTGGWVVDTVDRQPLHGGAVILIDEDLNTTSLRMYNETADPKGYAVKVEEATHAGSMPNPLHARIAGMVKPNASPWKAFSDTVDRAVYVRAQNLRAKMNTAR